MKNKETATKIMAVISGLLLKLTTGFFAVFVKNTVFNSVHAEIPLIFAVCIAVYSALTFFILR